MPSTRTPTSKRSKSVERKVTSRKKKSDSDHEDDNEPPASPGTPIVTIVGNMSLRSGTKLTRKKYSYNGRGEAEGGDVEPGVVAAPWPATTPAAARRARALPAGAPAPAAAPSLQRAEKPSSSLLPFIGTVLLICAVFLHWTSSSGRVPAEQPRGDANADREQVLSAVLRQQDNAIQHWRSQQNLMWPVVHDLEGKLIDLGERVGYAGPVSQPLAAGAIPLQCRAQECTDTELERALIQLLEQSETLAGKIQAVSLGTTKNQEASSVPVVVSTDGTPAKEVVTTNYCERIGKHTAGADRTMKDELICRSEYIVDATSRLAASHSAMKAQFQERIAQQEARLKAMGQDMLESDRGDGSTFSADKYADKSVLNFKDLLSDTMKKEMASIGLDTESIVSVVRADPNTSVDAAKEELGGIVRGVAHAIFNEYLVRDSNMASVMSVASQANSVVVDDIDELRQAVMPTVAAGPHGDFVSAVDVSNYVQEIIAQRKNEVVKTASEQLQLAIEAVSKEEDAVRPVGVFEYSSRMRGGKVFVRPLTSRLIDGASALAGKAAVAVLGAPNSDYEQSFERAKYLTTEPFSVTGSKSVGEIAGTESLLAGASIGSPAWAKRVLGTALGWEGGYTGADPQVVLNHLYPTESDDEISSVFPVVAPGNCYAFAGDKGNLTITFKMPVVLHSIAIYHPSLSLLPPPVPVPTSDTFASLGGVSSAPKSLSVFAWRDSKLSASSDDGVDFNRLSPLFLGNFTYRAVKGGTDASNSETQEYVFDFQTCPRCADVAMKAVTVGVNSNHGNPLFTCLYRVKVYGRVQQ